MYNLLLNFLINKNFPFFKIDTESKHQKILTHLRKMRRWKINIFLFNKKKKKKIDLSK